MPHPAKSSDLPDAITCRRALPEDYPALGRMLELYQYELSDIWDQDLSPQGEYGYDLTEHARGERFFAHVALVAGHYAGFALVGPAVVTQTAGQWMEQFFVMKKYRRTGVGTALAQHTLRGHPGPWEVGQIPDNLAASAFWRPVIGGLTSGQFEEVQVTEGWWQGRVQRFSVA